MGDRGPIPLLIEVAAELLLMMWTSKLITLILGLGVKTTLSTLWFWPFHFIFFFFWVKSNHRKQLPGIKMRPKNMVSIE